jgi:hypothetical protein
MIGSEYLDSEVSGYTTSTRARDPSMDNMSLRMVYGKLNRPGATLVMLRVCYAASVSPCRCRYSPVSVRTR